MTRTKRLLRKLTGGAKSLAEACGETEDQSSPTHDVATRRERFNRQYEACCRATERGEPCSRPPSRQCDDVSS